MIPNVPPSVNQLLEVRNIQHRTGIATLEFLGAGAVNLYAGVRYGDTTLSLLGLSLITGAGMAFVSCDAATAYADKQVQDDLTALTIDVEDKTRAMFEVWGITGSEQTPLGKP